MDTAFLQMLPTLFDGLDDLVLVKGPRSRLGWANRAFLEFYGMSNAQLEALVDGEHADPDDTLQYVRDDHQVFTTGVTLVVNEPVTNHAGTVHYFQTTKSPIVDAQGVITGTLGISKRVQSIPAPHDDERLRQERKARIAFQRAFTEHLPVAVVLVDMQCRVITSSAALRGLLGVDVVAPGTPLEVSLPALHSVMPALQRALCGAPEVQLTIQAVEELWLDVHVSPWVLHEDQVGALVTLVDVTTIRQNERHLTQANEALSKSNATIEEVAYAAAHDLQEPARMVRSYADLLLSELEPTLTEEQAQCLGFLQEGACRMQSLVNGILQISEVGLEPLERSRVEVGTLVDNAWSKLPHTDGVEVEIVGGEHLLNVDPHQLDLAVAGLLSNALKFRHPDREPLIAVRASADEAGVRLCVTDNGIGIVEEHQDRVFKMFTRLHLRRDYPGTGVGLALVKRVMQRHRGAVEVQSTGEGSAFTLVFPALDRLT